MAQPRRPAGQHDAAPPVSRFHVTVLSNFARGYDKYSQRYSKAHIPESTYPDRFYLLRQEELHIGIGKAGRLLERLQLPGDRLLVMHTAVDAAELQPNPRTGLGESVPRGYIQVTGLSWISGDGSLEPLTVEEAMAHSMRVLYPEQPPWSALTPRTVSVLPIAQGCQAACSFCFSTASVSADQPRGELPWERIDAVFREGRRRGAERAVITGGGEPGLLPHAALERLVAAARRHFDKVVLITNGYRWAALEPAKRLEHLERLHAAGLSVLAVSRHHPALEVNARIMHLDTRSEAIAETLRQTPQLAGLTLRWVCVLQRGGIEDRASLEAYLDWAAGTGATQVCFKELYVSASTESRYYDRDANRWSRDRQVPLRLVLETAAANGWPEIARLPWGAPIFRAERDGRALQVAAYTEPSVSWELRHGLCRSWNLMADGTCLASLEDRGSEVLPR